MSSQPSERGAHFCLLHPLAPVGAVAVRGLLSGLAGTQGHHPGLLGFELEWGEAGALEEVGAITEGLLLAAATHAPPVGFPCHQFHLDGRFQGHHRLGWDPGEPFGQPGGDVTPLVQLLQGA